MRSSKQLQTTTDDIVENLYDNGKHRCAIEMAQTILAKHPGDIQTLFYLGLSLYELGKFRQSVKVFNKVLTLSPRQKHAHLNLGCAHQNLGRSDLAIRHFKAELLSNPASPETLYSLGFLYFDRKDLRKAEPYLERCFGMNHTIERVFPALAHCYAEIGPIEKEIKLYDTWLQTHPKDAFALNNAGAALMQLGEFNRAEIYLRWAAKSSPDDKMISRNLAKNAGLRKRKTNIGCAVVHGDTTRKMA